MDNYYSKFDYEKVVAVLKQLAGDVKYESEGYGGIPYTTYKDPDNKGDVINFQMRFVALPLRTKAIAAIYSPLE